jgi:hypothetical protein
MAPDVAETTIIPDRCDDQGTNDLLVSDVIRSNGRNRYI